jgi:glycosyltransferase involved in cell wall biosynthesis
MMHLFVNACAASAGGGLTYIRNIVPHLASRRDVHTTMLLGSSLRRELSETRNLRFVEFPQSRSGALQRIWREQQLVPHLIRKSGADVLLSTGNFATFRSSVPQILLSRNALYVSTDFKRDLLARRHLSLWLDTKVRSQVAKRSIRTADCTIAPSESFAAALRNWTGCPVRTIHHGFDRKTFFSPTAPSPAIVRMLERRPDALRVLFVSHYNYYRNFETLFRALPLVRRHLVRDVQLVLTCTLEETTGGYRTQNVAALVTRLGIESQVLQLGPVPYDQLQFLYSSADIYVTAAYAETFAHPVVEAMACGLPIIASDLPVHREICRDAAIYFPRFSAQDLADRIAHLAHSPDLSADLARRGLIRSHDFSWERHTDEILNVARELVGARAGLTYPTQVDSAEGSLKENEPERYKAV